MAILDQLGINATLFIQVGLYLVTGFVMMKVLFEPYCLAFERREKSTIGSEEIAEEIKVKSENLQHTYEKRAREVNGDIKVIFDTFRAEAQKTQAELIQAAKAESEKTLEAARKKAAQEIAQARTNLKSEIPILAQVIQQKLLSK